MPTRRALLAQAAPILLLPALTACANLPFAEPPRVDLVGLAPLPGEGMELRFALRLRVQNPGDQAIAYDGISLELDLRGAPFARGVAAVSGSVPRFGEALITVPVTVSGFTLARQILGLVREGERRGRLGRVGYALRGRLGGSVFGGQRFESSGEIDLDLDAP